MWTLTHQQLFCIGIVLADNTRAPRELGANSSEEEALRRALDRMGARRLAQGQKGALLNGSPFHHDQPRARRRFAQDGDVQVEWRSSPPGAVAEIGPALSDAAAELRVQLNAELQAHAAAREQLREARAKIQHLETRLVHLQMDVREAEHRQAAAEVVVSAPEPASSPLAQPVRRGRPRKKQPASPGFPRQKPVKWW
jgi:hypothetical protein